MSQFKPIVHSINILYSLLNNSSPGTQNNSISTNNSTDIELTSGGSFTGTSEEVINYNNLILNIKSNVDSSINGVIVEFGNENNIWDIKYEYTYKASELFYIQIPIIAKYYRIRYINGSSNQSSFNLYSLLTSGYKNTNDSNGLFDAFGRLRVSEVKTLMDISHTYDNDNIMVDEKLEGGASASTYNSNTSTVITSVSSNGHKITRQSRKYCIYQPGKSLLVKFTCVLNAKNGGNDNLTSSDVGYFDESNGFFFRFSNQSLKIVYRTKISGSVVDTEIPQTNWSVNTLLNISNGYVLNPATVQIYFIDLQWLGVGRVRMGVVHNGHYIYCHEFLHDNIDTNVYITNANLPLRHVLSSTGGQAQTKLICSTVISEGGYDPVGMSYSASRGTSKKTISNLTETHLISIRLKSSRNRTLVCPTHFSIVNVDSAPTLYLLRLYRASTNPLTDPVWASVHNNSAVEYDISASTYNTTSSIIVSQGYFIGKSDIDINVNDIFSGFLQLTSNIDGISDILSLSAISLGNSNQDSYASIQWKEVF